MNCVWLKPRLDGFNKKKKSYRLKQKVTTKSLKLSSLKSKLLKLNKKLFLKNLWLRATRVFFRKKNMQTSKILFLPSRNKELSSKNSILYNLIIITATKLTGIQIIDIMLLKNKNNSIEAGKNNTLIKSPSNKLSMSRNRKFHHNQIQKWKIWWKLKRKKRNKFQKISKKVMKRLKNL